jgi:hypothetical protein
MDFRILTMRAYSEEDWQKALEFFKRNFTGEIPSLEGILYLIGVRELGKGFRILHGTTS